MRKVSKEEFIAIVSGIGSYRYDYLIKYKINNSWFLCILHCPNYNYIPGLDNYLRLKGLMNMKTKNIFCHSTSCLINDFCERVSEIGIGTKADLDLWMKYFVRYTLDKFGASSETYNSLTSEDFLNSIKYYVVEKNN